MDNQPPQPAPDLQKPVAYDADGNPLYAAPQPQAVAPQQPQVVHMTRAVQPVEVEVSDEVKQLHAASVKHFPSINLSEHEYVVRAVRRHPIGILGTVITAALSISIIFALMMNYPFFADRFGFSMNGYAMLLLIGILLTVLILIGGYIAIWVYMNNRFFLTNESVIQEIQKSVFSKREQTVSLMNIEDASFTQKGILQSFLNYGSIRLSTEGEETTYRFDYVADPKEHIAILNNAVEAFKNGRPVDPKLGSD